MYTQPQKKTLPEGKGFDKAARNWKKGNLFSSGDIAQRVGSLRTMGGL